MTEIEEYSMYNRCRSCGQIISDMELEDNEGLCNYCMTQELIWKEYPFGLDT